MVIAVVVVYASFVDVVISLLSELHLIVAYTGLVVATMSVSLTD